MSETDTYYIERCLDGHPDDFRYIVAVSGGFAGPSGR